MTAVLVNFQASKLGPILMKFYPSMQVNGYRAQLAYSQMVHINHEYHYVRGLWSYSGL